SVLGGAVGALFSPVGLIVAALVGGAVLVWKYWDQISAFFSGFFAGVWEALQPLREAFASLASGKRWGGSFRTLCWGR
ncbi:hypothetical protein, partial [Escherichia coli]|uniref:hypothetical protein n=1 Tax=Escherichia coli TaxID=562 RepID=UPI001BC8538C